MEMYSDTETNAGRLRRRSGCCAKEQEEKGQMKKYLALLLAALMVCVLFAGCGKTATGTADGSADSAAGGDSTDGEMVYRALYSAEVDTLNYLTTGEQWPQEVAANVIDTLVECDQYGQIIPGLATSWELSDDGLVWTFHLRDGVKWYDYQGKEVADLTAQDFVDALKYVCTSEYDSKTFDQVKCVKNAEKYFNKEITDFSQVGVKAVDEHTLEYTLERPTPYFLSVLVYVCYMPAYGPQLDELKDQFGVDNTKMYYCGAYILSDFEPQVKHVYVKNKNNWDADRIYITRIERSYNAEADTLAPVMALRGEIDYCKLSTDVIDEWKTSHADYVSRNRVDNMWNYFYCFDFRPTYAAEWGPENWALAVMNSNFRHSIMSAFDRLYCMTAVEPDDPESILQNTITPSDFAYDADGNDFVKQSAFADIDQYYFNKDKALEYKAKAVEELTAIGVTFPVTVVLTYNSSDTDWENEYVLLKQQLEGVLGTDYVTCVLNAGPSENFLSATRAAGDYSFMRCRWGADYVDPETWTDPFTANIDVDSGRYIGSSYDRAALTIKADDYKYWYTTTDGNNATMIANIDKITSSPYFKEFGEFYTKYYAAVDAAKAEGIDINKRYALFADAEAMLIENACVVPCFVGSANYQATRINIYDGQWSPSGISRLRYKWLKVGDSFIDMDTLAKNREAWEKAR